jgi:hypothetical protein
MKYKQTFPSFHCLPDLLAKDTNYVKNTQTERKILRGREKGRQRERERERERERNFEVTELFKK